MFLVYNSDVLPESDFQLSVNDRAFQYGDGLFETIRYSTEQIWFWSDHFARLSAGMDALQLTQPTGFSTEAVHQAILQVLSANKLIDQPARIKIQVWRQSGGLYTPSTNKANVLITARPGSPFSVTEKAKTGIYDLFRLSPSPVSAFKTLNSLPYVLAGLYKQQHGLDEIILLDSQGHLAECLASNLFWCSGKTLYTPSLDSGCINGIIRQQLVRLAPAVGLTVSEGLFPPAILTTANAVFCANVMGIQWLRGINDLDVDTRPLSFGDTESLLNALFAQFQG